MQYLLDTGYLYNKAEDKFRQFKSILISKQAKWKSGMKMGAFRILIRLAIK